MNKAAAAGGTIGGLGVLLMLIGGLMLIFGKHPGELGSPSALVAMALNGSPEEKDQAVLDLGRFLPPDYPPSHPLAKEAKECLRKLLNDRELKGSVRGNVIQGLGAMKDWDSMPLIIDALDDEDVNVRCKADAAFVRMVGMGFFYPCQESAEVRKPIVDKMRELGMADYNQYKKGRLK